MQNPILLLSMLGQGQGMAFRVLEMREEMAQVITKLEQCHSSCRLFSHQPCQYQVSQYQVSQYQVRVGKGCKLQKEGTLRRQMAFGRKEALKLEHSAALCWKYLVLPNYFPNNLPLVFYFPHLSLHDFFYIRC